MTLSMLDAAITATDRSIPAFGELLRARRKIGDNK